jgi:hypothetical protein
MQDKEQMKTLIWKCERGCCEMYSDGTGSGGSHPYTAQSKEQMKPDWEEELESIVDGLDTSTQTDAYVEEIKTYIESLLKRRDEEWREKIRGLRLNLECDCWEYTCAICHPEKNVAEATKVNEAIDSLLNQSDKNE